MTFSSVAWDSYRRRAKLAMESSSAIRSIFIATTFPNVSAAGCGMMSANGLFDGFEPGNYIAS